MKNNSFVINQLNALTIWVDADACPKPVREILFRTSERLGIALVLVANQPLPVPSLNTIRAIRVPGGFDVADHYISDQMNPGDLVITADIPLAADVVDKGGLALNPRGEVYNRDNVRAKLSMRDFMDSLRGSGVDTGGPTAYSQADRQAFANQLDRLLAQARQR